MRPLLSVLFMVCVMGCSSLSNTGANQCGNGVIEAGEECDKVVPASITCGNVNPLYPKGVVGCNSECHYDLSQCTVAQCGDGELHSGEVCDGTLLGGETCETSGIFNAGELRCDETCNLDLSQCSFECRVNASFEPCDPLAGGAECCPVNGEFSVCSAAFSDGTPRCQQTCSLQSQCGWSLFCDTDEHLCGYYNCGPISFAGGELNAECTLPGTREGWCYPLGNAVHQVGVCIENGDAEHGDPCTISPGTTGSLSVDPAAMCRSGQCTGSGFTGHCISYCDPIAALNGNDDCPNNYNCLNLSDLDFSLTDDEGNPNQEYLFREVDRGICYPQANNIDDAIPTGVLTCNLLSGFLVKGVPATPCPSGTACKSTLQGSLMGECKLLVASPAISGSPCVKQQPSAQAPCEGGTGCFIADPFNDPSQTNPAWACTEYCDATLGLEDNPFCEGLTTSGGEAFVCLTVSRFYTNDNELPSYQDKGVVVVEPSPSPLGYCVPPKEQ